MDISQEALQYHSQGRPGKIEVAITKPVGTQRDLSLAYTPGVAVPVRAIADDPDAAYSYTAKGNLVAVISNGTAVLGLGNVGAVAGKPVMEGKGVLFKRFADIDVFDLEIGVTDPDEFVKIVKALEPTFGGINLEDIKAPECFEIERRLKEQLSIPVFHDDQHGTAIISGAALLNALELAGKQIEDIRLVINGAGAAALACADFFVELGVKPEHLLLCDSKGVIYEGRTEGMNEFKQRFARPTEARTLADAMNGADVFVGLSVADSVSADMIKSMAAKPIVMALANPDPEIRYEIAREARPDAILATGRSDYPNQVNNVLGFPFLFRGALDVRATEINEAMKVAAARALASLARQEVPDSVLRAYNLTSLEFGPDYIIPKPVDPRVLVWVAPAVAQAAMESGVARTEIDIEEYKECLAARFDKSREIKRFVIQKATSAPKRVVYTEGEEAHVIRAAAIVTEGKIAEPILLGREEVIRERARALGIKTPLHVINPVTAPALPYYVDEYYKLRQRRGVTRREAASLLERATYFGLMMVHMGDADAFVGGLTQHYPDVVRPALEIVGRKEGVSKVAGMYIMIVRDKTYFLTDTTVNIELSAQEMAEIAQLAADRVTTLGIEPRLAMLSFSNFGSTRHPLSDKVRHATEMVKAARPDLMVDGEMQADTAVVSELIEREYPFSTLQGGANVLVFPSLEAANISYKLLQRLGGAEVLGPILMGMGKPVHVLQRGDGIDDIVNITAMAVVDAQENSEA